MPSVVRLGLLRREVFPSTKTANFTSPAVCFLARMPLLSWKEVLQHPEFLSGLLAGDESDRFPIRIHPQSIMIRLVTHPDKTVLWAHPWIG